MDLRTEYPPLIWNPTLGEQILVLWWSHEDQHHVILSTDLSGALGTWDAVLAKNDAEVRQYVEAILVPCPRAVADEWALNQYNVELSKFESWVLMLAQDAWTGTKKIPEGFMACPHKESSNARWDCKKCQGFRVRSTIDMKVLFENPETRALFRCPATRTISPWPLKKIVTPQPIQASITDQPLPFPDQPLQVAVLDAGHHANGVVFMPHAEWSGWTGNHTRAPILFFFQGTVKPIPQAFLDKHQKKMEARAEAAKKDKENRVDHSKERATRAIGILEQVMRGLLPPPIA